MEAGLVLLPAGKTRVRFGIVGLEDEFGRVRDAVVHVLSFKEVAAHELDAVEVDDGAPGCSPAWGR